MSRSQGQKSWHYLKGLVTRIHMCNIRALSLLLLMLWPRVKFFTNFKVKVTRSKLWYIYKVQGLLTSNAHVKYQSLNISSGMQVMAKVKVFQK